MYVKNILLIPNHFQAWKTLFLISQLFQEFHNYGTDNDNMQWLNFKQITTPLVTSRDLY